MSQRFCSRGFGEAEESHEYSPPRICHVNDEGSVRSGEILVAQGHNDRLVFSATTFRGSCCDQRSRGLEPVVDGNRVYLHLCWHFYNNELYSRKTQNLLVALDKVVRILKELDCYDQCREPDAHSGKDPYESELESNVGETQAHEAPESKCRCPEEPLDGVPNLDETQEGDPYRMLKMKHLYLDREDEDLDGKESMENPSPEFCHSDLDPENALELISRRTANHLGVRDLKRAARSVSEYDRNTLKRLSSDRGEGCVDEEMEEAFQTMEDSNLRRHPSDANLNGRDICLYDAQQPVRVKEEMVENSEASAMGRNPSSDLPEVTIKSRRPDRVPDPDIDVTRIPVPEVDAIFTGPGWQCMEDKERTTTVLHQFQYLEQHYKTMYLRGEIQTRGGRGPFRPDLKAGHYLLRRGFCLNKGFSVAGSIPGVEVGQCFRYREELLLLVVHRASQAGIDYITASKGDYKDASGQRVPVAVSIVASGGYRDNEDDGGACLIYTGQGGQSNKTNKNKEGRNFDQELVRGNRALVNSCKLRVPVRVTRGVASSEPGKRLYVYDGLYDVMSYSEDRGSSGFKVWKFKLTKQAGQSSFTVSKLFSRPPQTPDHETKVKVESQG